jgi:hypothetical protein
VRKRPMIGSMPTTARPSSATTTGFGVSSKHRGRDRRHGPRRPSLDRAGGLGAVPTVVVAPDVADLRW